MNYKKDHEFLCDQDLYLQHVFYRAITIKATGTGCLLLLLLLLFKDFITFCSFFAVDVTTIYLP